MKHLKSIYIGIPVFAFLVCLIYAPGVSGGFMFDDFSNIVNVSSIHVSSLNTGEIIEAWNAGFAGPSGRPVAIFSFALNYYYAGGLNPLSFKWVNIAIHLLNCLLVYLFLKSLFKYAATSGFSVIRAHSKSNNVPFLVALLWAIHPIQLSSVLYIVQRMNLLSATFTIIAMLLYIYIRGERHRLNLATTLLALFSLLITVLLGVFSKENAALVTLFIFLLEVSLFQYRYESKTSQFSLWLTQIFGVLLPILFILGFIVFNMEWLLKGYEYRDFNLAERLMTQARVVWTYFYWIINPDISNYGLFHDDIPISSSFTNPATTLISVLALIVLITVLTIFWKRVGLIGFGIVFFLIGHLLESTVLALEMVFEHRNYLPSLGVLLSVVLFFDYLVRRYCANIRELYKKAFILFLYFLIAFSTHIRAESWGNELLRSKAAVENHPNSARSQYNYAVRLSEVLDPESHYDDIRPYFFNAVELNPDSVEFLQGSMVFDLSAKKNINKSFYKKMKSLLATKPPHKTDLLRIDELINICMEGFCTPYFNVGALYDFIQNGIDNPKNDKVTRYSWQILLAKFHWQLAGEVQKAESILKSVIEVEPNQIVANAYLLDLRLEHSDKEQREFMLVEFENSTLGQRHPSVVDKLRNKYGHWSKEINE